MLLQREQMSGVPVYALGASSGGAFALILPWYIPIAGVCCQIMALPTDMYTQFLDNPPTRTMQPAISSFAAAAGAISPSDASEVAARSSVASEPVASSSPGNQAGAQVVKHPPVMFVHMPRDQHTAHQLAEIMEFRKQKVREVCRSSSCSDGGNTVIAQGVWQCLKSLFLYLLFRHDCDICAA